MLASALTLRLFYTAALNGQIDLLPRLFTYLRGQRAAFPGPSLLVDCGLSCASGTWICESTDGRAMLVAMDGMGYDAFHIGPADPLYRAPHTVDQVRRIVVTGFAAGPWAALVNKQGLVIQVVNGANLARAVGEAGPETDLVVGLRLSDEPASSATWEGGHRVVLFDPGLPPDATSPLIGWVDISLSPESPYVGIIERGVLTLPAGTPPDASMTGVIEFVQAEARYAERKRGHA
jgi:hypothetical protein